MSSKLKAQPASDLDTDPKILRAACTYLRRRDRLEHPAGSFDKAKRWYPDAKECLDTSCIRSPSRAYPHSYNHACRTIKHCAKLHGVSDRLTEVRREIRRVEAKATLAEIPLAKEINLLLAAA